MKTHDLTDQYGRIFAFEVTSTLGPVGVRKIIESIEGVKILKSYGYFSICRDETRCEFELNGKVFHVWEPWGDNSRYHIGPKEQGYYPEINVIRETFIKSRRPFFIYFGW